MFVTDGGEQITGLDRALVDYEAVSVKRFEVRVELRSDDLVQHGGLRVLDRDFLRGGDSDRRKTRASSVIGRCLHMRTGGAGGESVGRWLVCGWRVAMGGRRRAMGRAYGWAPSGHDTRRPRHRGRYRELTIAAPFGGVGREGGAVGCRFGDSRWLPSASGHSSSSPVFASDVVPLSLSLAPVRFLGCLEGPLEREGSIREQSAIEQSNPNI